MPLPTPRKGEREGDFVDRCMGDAVARREFPDAVQRRAVCQRQWDSKNSAKARAVPERMTFADREAGEVRFEGEAGAARFRMVAYTGGPLDTWMGPMYVDVAGMQVGKRVPILRNHEADEIVGHGDDVKKGDDLTIEGPVSGATAAAEQVVASSRLGFPWQASVGIRVRKALEVEAGIEHEVNGRKLTGPAVVITESKLVESSFVPMGADSETSAVAFAEGGSQVIIERPGIERPGRSTAALDGDITMTTDEMLAKIREQDPEALDRLRAEGADAAKLAEAARVTEIRGRYDPLDQAFSAEAICAGWSLAEANDQFAARAAEAIKARDKRIQALEAERHGDGGALSTETASVDAAAQKKLKKPPATDPKALAKWEWENGEKAFDATSEQNYMSVRVMQLQGSLRVDGKIVA